MSKDVLGLAARSAAGRLKCDRPAASGWITTWRRATRARRPRPLRPENSPRTRLRAEGLRHDMSGTARLFCCSADDRAAPARREGQTEADGGRHRAAVAPATPRSVVRREQQPHLPARHRAPKAWPRHRFRRRTAGRAPSRGNGQLRVFEKVDGKGHLLYRRPRAPENAVDVGYLYRHTHHLQEAVREPTEVRALRIANVAYLRLHLLRPLTASPGPGSTPSCSGHGHRPGSAASSQLPPRRLLRAHGLQGMSSEVQDAGDRRRCRGRSHAPLHRWGRC